MSDKIFIYFCSYEENVKPSSPYNFITEVNFSKPSKQTLLWTLIFHGKNSNVSIVSNDRLVITTNDGATIENIENKTHYYTKEARELWKLLCEHGFSHYCAKTPRG